MSNETYTKDSENIYFLNDKNIISSLDDESKTGLNPVVSKLALSSVKEELDERIDGLSGTVDDLNFENIISDGYVLKTLDQEKGRISCTIKRLTSSDVEHLDTYVKNEIGLSVESLTASCSSEGNVVTSVTEEGGVVNAGFSKITDSFIEDGTISQVKINGLTNDISEICSNYLQKNDFDSTLSGAFKDGDFRYDWDKHAIYLNIKGNVLSIDTTDVFKDRMIESVSVTTEGDTTYLVIKFKTTTGSAEVKLKIDEFFRLYKAGSGISISKDLTISADDSIARTADLDQLSSQVQNHEGYIVTLSSNGGIIDKLSNDISSLDWFGNTSMKIHGHIKDYTLISSSNTVSDIFKSDVYEGIDIYNGSTFIVELSDGVISAGTKVDGFVVGTGDYVVVHSHDQHTRIIPKDDLVFGENVFVLKAGVSLYDTLRISGDITERLDNEIQERTEADDFLSTKIKEKVWIKNIDSTDADLLSGTFADLSVEKITREDYERLGLSSMLKDNTLYVISSDYEDVYGMDVRNLSTPGAEGTSNAANTLYVDQTSSYLTGNISAVSSDLLSTIETVSSDLTDTISSVSSDLSDAISSKVFIRNYLSDDVTAVEEYTDLSVIKIKKDEYDHGVADKTLLSNCLYVVSSDYNDSYGMVTRNLSTEGIEGTSDAANTLYVDAKSTSAVSDSKKYTDEMAVNTSEWVAGNFLSNSYKTLSTETFDGTARIANDAKQAYKLKDQYVTTEIKFLRDGKNRWIVTSKSDYPSGTIAFDEDLQKKVFIENYVTSSDVPVVSGSSDLSVMKIRREDYEKLVVEETINNSCLYVISSDYEDMYGMTLQNLSTEGSGVSPAANTLYVDQKTQSLNKFEKEIISADTVLSIMLKQDLDSQEIHLSAVLSGLQYLFKNLGKW